MSEVLSNNDQANKINKQKPGKNVQVLQQKCHESSSYLEKINKRIDIYIVSKNERENNQFSKFLITVSN